MENYDSMMTAKSFLPYRMGYLTDWMVKQAEEELKETEENRAKALIELRRLIAGEEGLDIWTDDSYLLPFLRARKFEPQRAFELIKNFYTMLKDYPDVFLKDLDINPTNLMRSNVAGAFPYRHKDGGTVFFLNSSKWDSEQYPAAPATMALVGMVLSIAEDPAAQVCGVHVIYDAQLNRKHLRGITPRICMLYSRLLRNTLPIRFKAVHIINESIIFRYVFNILKMFLSAKIKERFHFHGNDMLQLHKYISKEILPPEYGGENINYSASDFCEKHFSPYIEKYREMLCKGYL